MPLDNCRVLVPLVLLIPALGWNLPWFWGVTAEVGQGLFKSEKLGDLTWFWIHCGGTSCYVPNNQKVHKAQMFSSLMCVTAHALFYTGIHVFVAWVSVYITFCRTVLL